MSAKPIMVQAFADAIGATKRQVQFWTDRGAVRCISETDLQGRGKQRHYDAAEIPIAALVAGMAKFQLPIGMLVMWSSQIRDLIEHGDVEEGMPGGQPADWYRRAIAGKHESFIVLRAGREGFAWTNRKTANAIQKNDPIFSIPVKRAVQRAGI